MKKELKELRKREKGARIITVAESRLNWFEEFYERIEIKDPTFLESILKEMGT